jgi:hypothetical protein
VRRLSFFSESTSMVTVTFGTLFGVAFLALIVVGIILLRVCRDTKQSSGKKKSNLIQYVSIKKPSISNV